MNAFKSNIYKYLGGTCQYLIPLYQYLHVMAIIEQAFQQQDVQ